MFIIVQCTCTQNGRQVTYIVHTTFTHVHVFNVDMHNDVIGVGLVIVRNG